MTKTATRTKRSDESKGPSFETSISRLESIVEQLDDGDLPLDQALALFKEGTGLAKQCRTMLAKAEVQVKEALRDVEAAPGGDDDEDDEEGVDEEDELGEDDEDVDEGDLDEEDEDEDKS